MTEMNDATKLRIRRELAERMGYRYKADNHWQLQWIHPVTGGGGELSDPFTNHTDCAALVEWLAANDRRYGQFDDALLELVIGLEPTIDPASNYLSTGEQYRRKFLTSPLETRVLAACAALGIDTGDE